MATSTPGYNVALFVLLMSTEGVMLISTSSTMQCMLADAALGS
jgi:hypothetical protein